MPKNLIDTYFYLKIVSPQTILIYDIWKCIYLRFFLSTKCSFDTLIDNYLILKICICV